MGAFRILISKPDRKTIVTSLIRIVPIATDARKTAPEVSLLQERLRNKFRKRRRFGNYLSAFREALHIKSDEQNQEGVMVVDAKTRRRRRKGRIQEETYTIEDKRAENEITQQDHNVKE